MADIDWTAINAKLPIAKTAEDKAKRKNLFAKFDPNGNHYLSLAEVQKGIRDVLKVDALFDAKPAVSEAFQIAKNRQPAERKEDNDYVQFREFRLFLLTLRQYFEYYEAFKRVDTSGDKRIELIEFKDAQPKIEQWVGKFDAEDEFKKIDTNGGGYILFDEFCKWAINKNLDLEDDDDDIGE